MSATTTGNAFSSLKVGITMETFGAAIISLSLGWVCISRHGTLVNSRHLAIDRPIT